MKKRMRKRMKKRRRTKKKIKIILIFLYKIIIGRYFLVENLIDKGNHRIQVRINLPIGGNVVIAAALPPTITILHVLKKPLSRTILLDRDASLTQDSRLRKWRHDLEAISICGNFRIRYLVIYHLFDTEIDGTSST